MPPLKPGKIADLDAFHTQAEPGAADEADVLAKVVATGIATGKGELIASILYPAPMLFKYDEELPVVVILLVLYAAHSC